MSGTPESIVPDCISTLELSKLWIYKALQEIQPIEPEPDCESEERLPER